MAKRVRCNAFHLLRGLKPRLWFRQLFFTLSCQGGWLDCPPWTGDQKLPLSVGGRGGDAWSACAPSELSESMVLGTASPGWRLNACVPSGLGRPYVCVPSGLGRPYVCVPSGLWRPYVCVPSGPLRDLRTFFFRLSDTVRKTPCAFQVVRHRAHPPPITSEPRDERAVGMRRDRRKRREER